jgi:hypothetical protein
MQLRREKKKTEKKRDEFVEVEMLLRFHHSEAFKMHKLLSICSYAPSGELNCWAWAYRQSMAPSAGLTEAQSVASP